VKARLLLRRVALWSMLIHGADDAVEVTARPRRSPIGHGAARQPSLSPHALPGYMHVLYAIELHLPFTESSHGRSRADVEPQMSRRDDVTSCCSAARFVQLKLRGALRLCASSAPQPLQPDKSGRAPSRLSLIAPTSRLTTPSRPFPTYSKHHERHRQAHELDRARDQLRAAVRHPPAPRRTSRPISPAPAPP
jgi:hypothetical protein